MLLYDYFVNANSINVCISSIYSSVAENFCSRCFILSPFGGGQNPISFYSFVALWQNYTYLCYLMYINIKESQNINTPK